MSARAHIAGGCLCGALRCAASGAPAYAGHYYCADCRKASGSGFIGFMGFPATSLRITGATRRFRWPAAGTPCAISAPSAAAWCSAG